MTYDQLPLLQEYQPWRERLTCLSLHLPPSTCYSLWKAAALKMYLKRTASFGGCPQGRC